MSDYSSNNQRNQNQYSGDSEFKRGGFKSSRTPGGRDSGGFRIRLSDNEMRAAKSIQEAFGLRSTVAVLGFAIRTLAQMLEEGKLNDLIANMKANQGDRDQNKRGNNRNTQSRMKNDFNAQKSEASSKPNPFARPEKPSAEVEKEQDAIDESNTTKDLSEDFNNPKNDAEVIKEKSAEDNSLSAEVDKNAVNEANQKEER